MRIGAMIEQSGPFVSFEFFPPKDKAQWPAFYAEVEKLEAARPLFVSVTYGAGGSTQANTLEIVSELSTRQRLTPMAHLTCVGAEEQAMEEFLDALSAQGVDNVLALRGDPPQDQPDFTFEGQPFCYANDLVAFIKDRHPEMGVAVAGYPETHPEADTDNADLLALKAKLDAGGDFVITQLFFDNQLYYDYVERARSVGITQPILPGVLPIPSFGSIDRILGMCGASMPEALMGALREANDADEAAKAKGEPGGRVRQLGIDHARQQVMGLLEWGAPGVHLYTLNKSGACLEIVQHPEVCSTLKACPA